MGRESSSVVQGSQPLLVRVAARESSAGLAMLLVAALASLAACGPASRGSFASNGYSSSYGYYVPYHGKSKELMPPGWQRDPKERVTSYAFDDNGDGIADEKFKSMTFALRFQQAPGAAAIWMRDIPLSLELRGKTLRLLAQRYLQELTGADYEAVRLDDDDADQPVATIVDEGPMLVAGRPAYFTRIDVPVGATSKRLELIFFRAPKDEVPQTDNSTRVSYPVLVIAGYSNLPDTFDAELQTFRTLLSRMIIEGKQGLSVVDAGAGSRPATSPPPPPASPVRPAAPAPAASEQPTPTTAAASPAAAKPAPPAPADTIATPAVAPVKPAPAPPAPAPR